MLASETNQFRIAAPFLSKRGESISGKPDLRGWWNLDLMIRVVDMAVALAAICFLAPLLAVVYVCIRLFDGGPAVFAQDRVGLNGQLFRCYKFRSMVVDAEQRLLALWESDPAARVEWARDQKLRHDPRVTWFGQFLRRSSIDELPQLFNVLWGQMSLIGPRPIVEGEVYRYGKYFSYYIQVKPGLTGLWQVSGRNDLTYRRRIAIDVSYVRSRSFVLNLKILFLTVPAVLASRGSR